MEDNILISYFNDFVFCPISIYFHKLYGNIKKETYQAKPQIKGTIVHESIDNNKYSSRKDILQGIDIYSDTFHIQGKIDLFDIRTGILTERKKTIKRIYDGYIFQLYAQYYALSEMGFNVSKLVLYSTSDNKNYTIDLPTKNKLMDKKFKNLIQKIREFDIEKFQQKDKEKCKNCIYHSICDRSKNVK